MNVHREKCNSITTALVLTVLLVISACTDSQNISKAQLEDYASQNTANQDITALNQKLFSAAGAGSETSAYLLGHGDLIVVTVFEAEELKTEVRVSARGFITLPLLGQVKVEDLTVRQAETLIEDLYREKYIKDPHVSVFIEENYSQRITLLGEIKNPGTYDYLSKQRLLDVLVLGGGLGEQAGRVVQIRRVDRGSGDQKVIMVDMDKLIEEGQSRLNIEINGGDVIFVPQSGVYFVDGAVRRPGSFPIRHNTTVQEAVQTAGGLRPYGDPSNVFLVRNLPTGKKEVIEIDLEDRAKGEIELKDRDVIFANSSSWGKFKYGAGISVGFPGVFSFGYKNPGGY